jgi:protoporphyrinogen IX oxidase
MLWIKAFHVICMVTWFSGLFYLPRLFVYHADAHDPLSNERFKIMEKRLYYYITTPGALLTTLLGIWLLSLHHAAYMQMLWLHIKLRLVGCLWIYHIYCGLLVEAFQKDENKHTAKFYRIFNEVPTVILISVILLVYIRPFQ